MFTRRQLLTVASATPLIGAPAIVRAQSWFAAAALLDLRGTRHWSPVRRAPPAYQ